MKDTTLKYITEATRIFSTIFITFFITILITKL